MIKHADETWVLIQVPPTRVNPLHCQNVAGQRCHVRAGCLQTCRFAKKREIAPSGCRATTTSVPAKTLHRQGEKFQLDMIRRKTVSPFISCPRLSSARVLLLHRCNLPCMTLLHLELPRYRPMHAACSRNRIVSSACLAAEPPSPSAFSPLN